MAAITGYALYNWGLNGALLTGWLLFYWLLFYALLGFYNSPKRIHVWRYNPENPPKNPWYK